MFEDMLKYLHKKGSLETTGQFEIWNSSEQENEILKYLYLSPK